MLFLRTKNVARFEKVSFEEFKRAFYKLYLDENGGLRARHTCYSEPDGIFNAVAVDDLMERKAAIDEYLHKIYDNIVIPEAKTQGAAGHDITVPFDFELKPFGIIYDVCNFTIVIPTGLKVFIKKGWCLKFYPRSGWGTKGLKIENTVPIIDWDYYNNPDNEGHILLKITNESKELETFTFKGGDTRIVQGLFEIYGLAGKANKKKRAGGFNSTSEGGSVIYK